MRKMRLPVWLVLAGTFLAGCAAGVNQTTMSASDQGPINLFTHANGYGSINMRLVDMRKGRSVQAVADADTWDRIELRVNSLKLRAPRVASMSLGDANFLTPRQTNYSVPQLGQLPPANDYSLLVTLASQSATSSPIVGQGASTSINVPAGANIGVTIFINAVGQISFFSPDYYTATGSAGLSNAAFGYPELVGGTTVDIETAFPNSPGSPADQQFINWSYEFRDLLDNVMVSSPSAIATSLASRSFTVPYMGSNEFVGKFTVLGYNNAGKVLAAKSRNILILRGATVSATLN